MTSLHSLEAAQQDSLTSEYKVNLEVFEGPLDLLLYLIKKEEIAIYDISIERITKQYLAFMEAFEELNIAVAGEFVVMAANLLYLKSRTLLPQDQQMPEEEVEEDDPRWELIRQLIEYKKFKEAALHLHNREELQKMLFPRPEADSNAFSAASQDPLLLKEVGIFDLINAFQKALTRLSRKETTTEIFEESFTVADRMQHLIHLLAQNIPVTFEELFSSSATRTELVVTFLAILELIRMKQVVARQEEQFGQIWIERR
ncbi:MAG: segregation/condensation protein A [Chthoniobacterales bacterium]|nr:segregation/condensation protein A [Chthoniobacterales bacterium]